MSWSIVARNRRYVHLDIKLVGAPVFHQVRFAAGRDLDSCEPLSRALPAGVESATRIVRFVVLTVVELGNVWHDDQLEQSGEKISAEVTPESLRNPKKLGNVQKRVR
jgi:hypothetical protein